MFTTIYTYFRYLCSWKKNSIFLKIYPKIIMFCVSVQECLHALPRKMWSFQYNVSWYFQRQTVYDTACSTDGVPWSMPGILCHVHITHSYHFKKSICSLWFILKYYLFTTKHSFSTEECHYFFSLFKRHIFQLPIDNVTPFIKYVYYA